jgi:PAS domain S-box-containing protein
MLPETVFEVDPDGKITFVNNAGLKLFGYSREDLKNDVYIRSFIARDDLERLDQNVKKILCGEKDESNEYMAIRRDGSSFPILIHSRPVIQDNKPVGLRGVLIDISANYKMRKELEYERDFISSLLDTANSLIMCLDTNDKIIVFNKECEKITGYTFEEIRGENWRELLFPKERQQLDNFGFSENQNGRPVTRFECSLLTKTGEVKYILWSHSAFSYPESGEKIAIAVGHDITERKKAEKNLVESEKHFRAVWDNLPVGICLTDRDGIYRYVNPAYCKMYGYTKEELIGNTPDGLIFPDANHLERKKHYNERFNRQIPTALGEYKYYKSDGSPVWVEVSSDFIKEDDHAKFLISINIDITKRKSAESALLESEQRYSLLFEHAGEAVATVNCDGVFGMVNKAAAAYLGGMPEDFIGKNMWQLFPKKIARKQMENIHKALEVSKPRFFEDYTIINNEKRWYKIGIYPIKKANKAALSALIIASDITSEIRSKIRTNTRYQLLDSLRHIDHVDACLKLGCNAIRDSRLFKKAIFSLHNENREVEHLAQTGPSGEAARTAWASKIREKGFTKKTRLRKFKIGNSYFIPVESRSKIGPTGQYTSEINQTGNSADLWKKGDELFVPVYGSEKRIEGWLFVDSPFDGKRPSLEIIRFLEEITEIVMQRSREIHNMNKLASERKTLEEKNIALREILGHIEEEKAAFKQRIADNIEQVILPSINRMIGESESVKSSDLLILNNILKDLATISGGITRLYSKLSPREIEVCNLIKVGNTSKEIAKNLKISVATVQKHREIVRRKLGLINKDVNLPSYLKNL